MHLSNDQGDDPDAGRKNHAHLIYKVRKGLDSHGLQEKTIGYTTRYNAAWDDDSSPDGWTNWNNDGEALTMDNEIKDKYDGASLSDVVDYVNIMLYD